jgi:hypothetical protein
VIIHIGRVNDMLSIDVGTKDSKQEGSFGGFYILSGIEMQVPETQTTANYERHKSVVVK